MLFLSGSLPWLLMLLGLALISQRARAQVPEPGLVDAGVLDPPPSSAVKPAPPAEEAEPSAGEVEPAVPAQGPAPAPAPEKSVAASHDEASLSEHVRIWGLLQVDAVPFHQSSVDELDPDTREPLNEDRFVLRRARVGVEAHYGIARGMIQIDGSTVREPTVRVLAAELGIAYPSSAEVPLVEVALGLFLIPFGLETRELATGRLFLEASTWSQALFPGRRDLGARVSGGWSFVRYALAVTNGNPSSGPLALRDPNRAKDLVGRLGVDGPLFSWLRVSSGVSALVGRGFHAGMAPTKDELVVRDINEDGLVQLTEVSLIPGHPGDASRNFDRNALGADVALDYTLPVLGAGRTYGELVWAQNLDRGLFVADPIAQGRDVRELGFMVAIRQYVTRHVEIGARYDLFDPDRDASRRQGLRFVPSDAHFSTISGVIAWCSIPHLRVSLQYDHRTNPLGRTSSGNPTTLAADSLTVRGQLSY